MTTPQTKPVVPVCNVCNNADGCNQWRVFADTPDKWWCYDCRPDGDDYDTIIDEQFHFDPVDDDACGFGSDINGKVVYHPK
jgi:hypothetical protein